MIAQVYYSASLDVIAVSVMDTECGYGPASFLEWWTTPYNRHGAYVIWKLDKAWIHIGDIDW